MPGQTSPSTRERLVAIPGRQRAGSFPRKKLTRVGAVSPAEGRNSPPTGRSTTLAVAEARLAGAAAGGSAPTGIFRRGSGVVTE